jgi:hypothetical protein
MAIFIGLSKTFKKTMIYVRLHLALKRGGAKE